MARRAAALIDVTAPDRTETGASSVLWEDEESIAWLNVMPEPRDTGYHDHDGSAAGICMIEGNVTNEGLPLGGPRRPRHYGPGDSFWLPGSAIHRMYTTPGRSRSTYARRRCAASATTRSSAAWSSAPRDRPTKPHLRARSCWNPSPNAERGRAVVVAADAGVSGVAGMTGGTVGGWCWRCGCLPSRSGDTLIRLRLILIYLVKLLDF
jgi:hypothetical protein